MRNSATQTDLCLNLNNTKLKWVLGRYFFCLPSWHVVKSQVLSSRLGVFSSSRALWICCESFSGANKEGAAWCCSNTFGRAPFFLYGWPCWSCCPRGLFRVESLYEDTDFAEQAGFLDVLRVRKERYPRIYHLGIWLSGYQRSAWKLDCRIVLEPPGTFRGALASDFEVFVPTSHHRPSVLVICAADPFAHESVS